MYLSCWDTTEDKGRELWVSTHVEHLIPHVPVWGKWGMYQMMKKTMLAWALIIGWQWSLFRLLSDGTCTVLISVVCVHCSKLSSVDTLGERKKRSTTGAGRLRECKNAEFVWEFNKTGVAISRAVCLRECPLRELRHFNFWMKRANFSAQSRRWFSSAVGACWKPCTCFALYYLSLAVSQWC